MSAIPFVGRRDELVSLRHLLSKKIASLVVIKGRRRIGKSRLVDEFAKGNKYYRFSGLPPTAETTAQSQRDEFTRQMSEQFKIPALNITDWGDLFTLLASYVKKDRVIILIDEITWMGSKDSNFLGKLKIAWDVHFKKNPKLVLILCGSVSSWIQKNIISSTGFLGRISEKITLEELSLPESNQLLAHIGFKGSDTEKLMLLSVIGGIPAYLELINPSAPATENIKKLCFEHDGILVDEFKLIFHDLFGRRGEIYRKIVEKLANGPAEYTEIAHALKYTSSGPLSEYLDELVISGFVSRDYTWVIKANKESGLSRYRLRDNYLRFYVKYIAPRLDKIKKKAFKQMAISSLPGWESMMGLQLENLVLNNRLLIQEHLRLKQNEIDFDNPFFQRKTARQSGCQIDYLIQTRFKTLYICEIKFLKHEVPLSIISEVQQKIEDLKYPKGFSCKPVLIHVNGVHEKVVESEFFAAIIDLSELL